MVGAPSPTLITGPRRSGKTTKLLRVASTLPGPVLFYVMRKRQARRLRALVPPQQARHIHWCHSENVTQLLAQVQRQAGPGGPWHVCIDNIEYVSERDKELLLTAAASAASVTVTMTTE